MVSLAYGVSSFSYFLVYILHIFRHLLYNCSTGEIGDLSPAEFTLSKVTLTLQVFTLSDSGVDIEINLPLCIFTASKQALTQLWEPLY